MQQTQVRGLMRAACFLLLGASLVQGLKHDKTVTLTESSAAIKTMLPSPANTNSTETQRPTTPVSTNLPTTTPSMSTPSSPSPEPTQPGGGQQEVFLTIAVQQAVLANFAKAAMDDAGVVTIEPPNAVASPMPASLMMPESRPGASDSTPAMQVMATEGAPQVAAQAATERSPSSPATEVRDPALGGFPGGNPPSISVDLPLTILFLVLYVSGAVTHISIYRANAKRGHKFLLSDLMFDFCMVRTLTCLFRIIWVFTQVRGIILLAQLFLNGG